MIDSAQTVIVIAKEPLPGRAKTRLQQRFTADEAAGLAAAALQDTLAAVRRCGARRRVLAWSGDPTAGREWSGDPTAGREWSGDPTAGREWSRGPVGRTGDFRLVEQGSGDLAERLGRVLGAELAERPGVPTLLIAMDTPQVSAELLNTDWRGADAVIGLAEDGGYWAIGLRNGPAEPVFDGIEMSTDRTGAAQLARLLDLGLTVTVLPPMRDVDEPADAESVAESFPGLAFSARHRELLAGSVTGQPVQMIFDHGYNGGGLVATTAAGVDPLQIDLSRWQTEADGADRLVIARCQQPVLDIGCGPGRMVAELTRTGRSSLGIDISRSAIAASWDRGGPALRRNLTARLPGEGRWGTVLLMDSNIGIGGDVDALLRRCVELVAPGGLIICETDPDPEVDECHDVLLTSRQDGAEVAGQVRWARIGADALTRRAWRLNLVPAEHWTAAGRDFVALRSI